MTLIEFNPVDHITVGAVGPPGERIFMLQARRGEEVVTLLVEKEQVVALGRYGLELLSRLGHRFPANPDPNEMTVAEGSDPVFRVSEIAIAYQDPADLILIECRELVEEEEADPARARFWVTQDQLAALGRHGLELAAQGRPVCPYCWQPMDPSGHLCPARNGGARREQP
jgi:uncharacterized repeat protein (TIGR03847 family)